MSTSTVDRLEGKRRDARAAASARPDKPNGNGAPAVEDKAPALTGAE